MIRNIFSGALLCGTAFGFAAPAFAQELPQAEQTTADIPGAANGQASAAPADRAQAQIDALQDQVKALQIAIDGLKAQVTKVTPSWKGAPQIDDKSAGFSFKPRGTIQMDAGFVGYPGGDERRGTVGGLNYANLGFNARARRLLLGAEGTLPGGFRYSAEFNFAQGGVDYEDLILAYDMKKTPLSVQIGNFFPFSSLESMTSSRSTSFLERASQTDAFNFNRRLGVGLILSDKTDDSYVVQAGVFSQPINDASFTRSGWQASLRGVYSPVLGGTRLHLGANGQRRVNNREAMGAQYRARPLTQITDQRFIDTGIIASRGDTVVGVELGAIHKSLHFAAEGQKVWVRDAFTAGEIAALNGSADNNRSVPAGAVALEGDPGFSAGYLELGYFLTGETRGYKSGRWDRTKVLRPFNDGGWGAFQVNGRIDYVDLRDRVADSSSYTSPFYLNGGKQIGYQVSLIWNPVDYVRFMAQYGRVEVTGGPRAATAVPASSEPLSKRNYGVNTAAVRAQVDF